MKYSRNIKELIHFSVINVNKPSGPLSRDVDDKIRKIFKVKKVGHSGTLDPKVSGVLLVAMDEATKILKFLMKSDKEYEGIMYLHNDIEKKRIEQVIIDNFTGKITQTPPVKSMVARKPRQRVVYSFNILKKEEQEVTFRTRVEAGTYIRKLIHDLGQQLGTGAHMKYLKRIKTGKFDIKDSYTLQEIEEAYNNWKKGEESGLRKILMPIEDVINMKKVVVNEASLLKIRNGRPVKPMDIIKKDEFGIGDTIGIFSPSGKIVGLGTSKTRNKIKTDRIFIYANTTDK
jgi:H/ACA ribonucleoprotein complex subunit 4